MDGGKERWRKRKGLEVSQVEQMKGIRKERKREREKKTQACKNVRIRSQKGNWNVHLSKMTEVLKLETKVALRCQK